MNIGDAASRMHEENIARFRVLTCAILEWNGHIEGKIVAFLTDKGNAMGLRPLDIKQVLDEAAKRFPSRSFGRPSGQGRVMTLDPKNLLTVMTHAIQIASGEAGDTKAHVYPNRNLVEDIRGLNQDEYRFLVKALDLTKEALQNT